MFKIPMSQMSAAQLKKAQDLLRLREMFKVLDDVQELAGQLSAAQITGLKTAIVTAASEVRAKVVGGPAVGMPTQKIYLFSDTSNNQAVIYTQNVEVVLRDNLITKMADLDAEIAAIVFPSPASIVLEVDAAIDNGDSPSDLLAIVTTRLRERDIGLSKQDALQITRDRLQELLDEINTQGS